MCLTKQLKQKIYLIHFFSFIKGYQINKEDRKTFQDCQMCTENVCSFRSCHCLLNSSIFCQNISDTSQRQVTVNISMSKECLTASTVMTNFPTSEEPFASTSTITYSNTDQSSSINTTQQLSSNVVLLC